MPTSDSVRLKLLRGTVQSVLEQLAEQPAIQRSLRRGLEYSAGPASGDPLRDEVTKLVRETLDAGKCLVIRPNSKRHRLLAELLDEQD